MMIFNSIPFYKENGFTLVEISIVMIIIGLLISGIFGGMKLIDNANIQKTVQDLKAIESAALTFRDTYRALPGDIRNPNTRIPNCTVAPCNYTGNGNRQLDATGGTGAGITNNSSDVDIERFSFWHHLQASALLQMDYSNTTSLNFGEGQPSTPIGGGYRQQGRHCGGWWAGITINCNHLTVLLGGNGIINSDPLSGFIDGYTAERIDRKIDDGLPVTGKLKGSWCSDASANPQQPYISTAQGCWVAYVNGW